MTAAANDGPVRLIFAARGIDARKLAEYFEVDEGTMSSFLEEYEEEILEAMQGAAIQTIEELGFLTMLFPLSEIEADE